MSRVDAARSSLATLPQRRPLVALGVSIVVCELVGASGSIFTAMGLQSWYPLLMKPALNPPNWVFGPVWSTLFALIGFAAWRVWRAAEHAPHRAIRLAAIVFVGQFALNVAWSAVFFGAQSPLGGLVVLIALWIAILAMIVVFRRVDRWSAWPLLPYLAWVSFAGYLNYSIWALN